MFTLYKDGFDTNFYIDENADAGVREIAGIVCRDFTRITGKEVVLQDAKDMKGCNCVLFAQDGKSIQLDTLCQANKIDMTNIRGKWEVYGDFLVEKPIDGVEHVFIIAGSDKRGTIYGMFDLSEKMGISPLDYWADAVVPHKDEIVLDIKENYISKEPSVKYRGFFINDEWPCFGNWSEEHFGGFTKDAYKHVYELLLRLKGNYLWPAMWSSSFALDGPDQANAELADLYGVVIGNSHHEPCLRASEEWDKVRSEGSYYGNAWNFKTNKEGLLHYWEDGLKRSAKWESMVTVGMRGERDSKILSEDATLKDNIDLLKDTIHCQKELVYEAEKRTGKKLPMLLALYKEVEPYYYGDEQTEGLCDWPELSDITLMLCEDNFGYTRTLPDDKMRKHPAGFGMYYHLDYHGGPISYEWINSTPLSKVWEQMSQAYDYGVRNVWIVNVGDLKFNEFPLSYFMNLAYDFDTFGTNAPNTYQSYTMDVMKKQFSNLLTETQLYEAVEIITETVRLNGLRRPEALNERIYHPVHELEGERMLYRAFNLEKRMQTFYDALNTEAKAACYSLFGFETFATANLLKMHLYAGMNQLRAKQGRKETNQLADKVRACIKRDKQLSKEWTEYKDGKWKGMEMASHIGFTKWNEDGCQYPVMMEIEPFGSPRMQVTASDDERVYDKVYGAPMEISLEQFCYDEKTVSIDVANTGIGQLCYEVTMPDAKWLSINKTKGVVEDYEKLIFTYDEAQMSNEKDHARVKISDGDTTVMVVIHARVRNKNFPKKTFLEGRHGFVMNAKEYYKKYEPGGVHFTQMDDYGFYENGMKAYPDTAYYNRGEEPSLTYQLNCEKEGKYICDICFAPTNPLKRNNDLMYGIIVNDEKAIYENTVPKQYKSGESSDFTWSMGALNHRRIVKQEIYLKEGINQITILLLDAGLVLERIYIHNAQKPYVESYMGPEQSYYVN